MTFWSGEKISDIGKHNYNFISDFDEKRIDCSAYTLKVGNEYFVTADALAAEGERFSRKKSLKTGESFVIPPGQFAFLLTQEKIEIPADVMAFISMKATYKFQGLINVSGFHVDPGYRGSLVFSVYNAGPSPVHLAEGLPLFLIWFADLDRISSKTRSGDAGKSLSNDLLKAMSGKILSFQSISEEITSLRNEMAVQRKLFGWGVGIASAVVGSLLVGSIVFFLGQSLLSKSHPETPSVVNSPTTIVAPRP